MNREMAEAIANITARMTGARTKVMHFNGKHYASFRWQGRDWVRLDGYCCEVEGGRKPALDDGHLPPRMTPVRRTHIPKPPQRCDVDRLVFLASARRRTGRLA